MRLATRLSSVAIGVVFNPVGLIFLVLETIAFSNTEKQKLIAKRINFFMDIEISFVFAL